MVLTLMGCRRKSVEKDALGECLWSPVCNQGFGRAHAPQLVAVQIPANFEAAVT